jgi:hypothetical protein
VLVIELANDWLFVVIALFKLLILVAADWLFEVTVL